MKPSIWKICLIALYFSACGGNPAGPQIVELPIYNTEFTIEPGAFTVTGFVVDLTQMAGPLIVGSVGTTGGLTGTINILILNTANFTMWESGEPYTPAFESGQTQGGTFEAPISTTDNYVLVFSNRSDTTDQKVVGATISLFFEVISAQ